ncbi:MAG: hypothetical protein KAR06_05690 [Deltaproteobacteria bacterium]|nr:hypothetical protein [Deltaproteobacteria bacterium]
MDKGLVQDIVREVIEQYEGSPTCPLGLEDREKRKKHDKDHEGWHDFNESLESAKKRGKWIGAAILLWIFQDIYEWLLLVIKSVGQFFSSIPK